MPSVYLFTNFWRSVSLMPDAFETAGIWIFADSGLILGSSPEPELVSKSVGISSFLTPGWDYKKSSISFSTLSLRASFEGAKFCDPEPTPLYTALPFSSSFISSSV